MGSVHLLESYLQKPYYAVMVEWNERLQGKLTPREIEILYLLSRGSSNKAIADMIFLHEKTIRFHITNINKKLKCRSSKELVAYAYNNLIME